MAAKRRHCALRQRCAKRRACRTPVQDDLRGLCLMAGQSPPQGPVLGHIYHPTQVGHAGDHRACLAGLARCEGRPHAGVDPCKQDRLCFQCETKRPPCSCTLSRTVHACSMGFMLCMAPCAHCSRPAHQFLCLQQVQMEGVPPPITWVPAAELRTNLPLAQALPMAG